MKKSIFLNDSIFNSAPYILTAIGIVFSVFFVLNGYNWEFMFGFFFMVVDIVCLFITISAYKGHDKNPMKAMQGFLLMSAVSSNLYMYYMCCLRCSVPGVALITLMVLISIELTVNHLFLSSTHESRTGLVLVNRLSTAAYVLCSVAFCVVVALTGYESKLDLGGTSQYVGIFSTIVAANLVALFTVVSIEGRVNEFKLQREQAANGQ